MNGGTQNESYRVVSPKVPVTEHVLCVSLLFDYDLATKNELVGLHARCAAAMQPTVISLEYHLGK